MDGFWQDGEYVLVSTLQARIQGQEQQLTTIRARLETAEADAARYRFLRGKSCATVQFQYVDEDEETFRWSHRIEQIPEAFDAAIDAELAKEGKS